MEIGFDGVSFAFGLTILTMAYTISHISDCHLNPAVPVGLVAGGRFPSKERLPYIISQVIGGVAAAVLYVIASGKEGLSLEAGFVLLQMDSADTLQPNPQCWTASLLKLP